MRNILTLLTVLLLSSCGTTYKLSTLNHDPIYGDENYITVADGVKVDTLNEFQFRNKIRTDIGFRLDFARYALSQPISFDWNNRLLGGQYNYRWNSYYWNRDQMWNDWAWGYNGWNSWGSPHRWSPFGYDRWGYNMYYGWNNHGWGYNGYYGNGWNSWGYNGWNNYYGQNNWYGRRGRGNVSYINGRRGSISNEVISNRRVNSNTRINKNKSKVINNNNDVVINKEIIKLRRNNPNIKIINNSPNNNTRPRGYGRPELNNNRNNNNTRPVIRNNNRPNNNNTRSVRVSPPRNSGGRTVVTKRNQ